MPGVEERRLVSPYTDSDVDRNPPVSVKAGREDDSPQSAR